MAALKIGEPPETATVVVLATGELSCNCGVGGWCNHRAEVIQDALDAPDIHAMIERVEFTELNVPIVPTHGLYFKVNASPMGGYGNVRIMSGETFFGVIGLDEGLGAIRSLVIAKMMGEKEEDAILRCTSKSHRYNSQVLIDKMIAKGDTTWLYAHNFSVWATGMCMKCAELLAADIEDVVPDFGSDTTRRVTPW